MTSERVRKIEEKAIEEFRSFFVMALYLWFVFGLMLLNEAVILKKPSINFLAQGFAVINALVLAKVMLIADDFRFGRELDHLPLVWPILYKAVTFGLLFVAFPRARALHRRLVQRHVSHLDSAHRRGRHMGRCGLRLGDHVGLAGAFLCHS